MYIVCFTEGTLLRCIEVLRVMQTKFDTQVHLIYDSGLISGYNQGTCLRLLYLSGMKYEVSLC